MQLGVFKSLSDRKQGPEQRARREAAEALLGPRPERRRLKVFVRAPKPESRNSRIGDQLVVFLPGELASCLAPCIDGGVFTVQQKGT